MQWALQKINDELEAMEEQWERKWQSDWVSHQISSRKESGRGGWANPITIASFRPSSFLHALLSLFLLHLLSLFWSFFCLSCRIHILLCHIASFITSLSCISYRWSDSATRVIIPLIAVAVNPTPTITVYPSLHPSYRASLYPGRLFIPDSLIHICIWRKIAVLGRAEY